MGMLALAKVDGTKEVVYALSALGCLTVGGILVWVIVLTRVDRPSWTRMRRFMWAVGAVTGTMIALSGAGFVGLWARGADWSLHSASSSTGTDFCASHECIPNFHNGNGSTVQCADGTYSHSGGLQGACSHHGGEA